MIAALTEVTSLLLRGSMARPLTTVAPTAARVATDVFMAVDEVACLVLELRKEKLRVGHWHRQRLGHDLYQGKNSY